jgi:putative Ca2+/H+ antiporter (TMEM165/GDT1 family)
VNLGLAASVFGVMFLAELPDKTMIATVLMGSRSRASAVWLGASAAFLIHMGLAAIAGHFLSLLPHRAVEAVVTVLFLGGAAFLLFVPESEQIEEAEEEAEAEHAGAFLKVAATAFGVILIGEFGDLTQILAANFVAHSHEPWTVFAAGSLALISVAALGAFGGRALLRVLPLSRIRKAGGVLLALFGLYTLYQLAFG